MVATVLNPCVRLSSPHTHLIPNEWILLSAYVLGKSMQSEISLSRWHFSLSLSDNICMTLFPKNILLSVTFKDAMQLHIYLSS